MLYLIGLGLNNEKDLSLRAMEILKDCDSVYAEFYTSRWFGSLENLGKKIKKKIVVLPREKVESEFLLDEAAKRIVVFLVPGDPLAATTHMELVIEAKKRKINVKTIHNSSIMTAISQSGLWLYKFGRAVTLVRPEGNYNPKSPFEMITANKKAGLHTLVLLDVKENQSYMTVTEALNLLKEFDRDKILKESIVACICLGTDNEKILYRKIDELIEEDIEETPAVLIITGELHFKEKEALELFA